MTLILPILILLVLFGLDFGRAFLGWVTLNNAVREAANFAAANPTAWDAANPDLAAQDEYARLVRAEAAQIDCVLPSTIPAPSFANGLGGPNAIGTPARVTITCGFRTILPIGQVLALVGSPSTLDRDVAMSATAAFPVRNGVIEGIPVASLAPTPSPRPSPSPSPSSSASPSPTASPTPTPIPMCDVPNLVGVGVGQVQQKWSKAGFATQVVFVPQAPNKPTGKDTVNSQNPASGSLPCLTTAMSVTWSTKP